jgi:predicted ATPase
MAARPPSKYRVEKVHVSGFWGDHTIDLRLDRSVTFLIGQNGSGKTTFINLLAAALTADFPTLDRIAFKDLTITLSADASGTKPEIRIKKKLEKKRSYDSISYDIGPNADGNISSFSLEEVEEQRFIRNVEYHLTKADLRRRLYPRLAATLREMLNVNWLSVHRGAMPERRYEDRHAESPVDVKIETISTEIAKYFSALTNAKEAESRAFQESLFSTLFEVGYSPFQIPESEEMHESALVLRRILQEMRVDETKSSELVSKFEEKVAELREHMALETRPQDYVPELTLFYILERMPKIFEYWQQYQNNLSDIFSVRHGFENIMNSMLRNKNMRVTDNNELSFVTRSNKILTPQMLSSGEKQLLIFLSEAMLQRRETSIFIADEPEISLHVSWQERLISSLQTLNPAAQIVVATHSPDIVGHLGEKAIDMETVVG